jgi:arylformamidase
MIAQKNVTLIELSHTIEAGMITYKGLPGPVITDHLSREASRSHYAEGIEFYIGKIEMVANTGTYLDTPFHRYAEGNDLSMVPLSSVANLDGVVVDASSVGRAIGKAVFEHLALKGKAVLVHTGWDAHWRTEQYFDGHPYLTREAVQYLVDSQIELVGIDSLNIDSTQDAARPAHSLFLAAGIPIVEHLTNLQSLPDTGFRFFAAPAKVKGLGTFPVRAFALLE